MGTFVGVGRNKRQAKCAAAKLALRYSKEIEEQIVSWRAEEFKVPDPDYERMVIRNQDDLEANIDEVMARNGFIDAAAAVPPPSSESDSDDDEFYDCSSDSDSC